MTQKFNSGFPILSTLKKDYDYRKYKVDEFANLIHSLIDININDYKLNYETINEILNFPPLTKLFIELGIDISDFNKNSTVALNIIPYYEDGVHQLRNDLQNRFDILLYQNLRNKSIEEKVKFLELQSQFETFNQFDLENSIKIDIKTLFIETIKKEFQVDLSLEQETVNLTEIFQKNKSELITMIKPLDKTILNQIIENESKLRSLIYFAKYVDIINEYNILIEKTEDKKGN